MSSNSRSFPSLSTVLLLRVQVGKAFVAAVRTRRMCVPGLRAELCGALSSSCSFPLT